MNAKDIKDGADIITVLTEQEKMLKELQEEVNKLATKEDVELSIEETLINSGFQIKK